MKCPKCGKQCWRDEHPDGYMVGPWGCSECEWSETLDALIKEVNYIGYEIPKIPKTIPV